MSRYGNVKAGAYNKLDVSGENNDTNEKLNDVERVLSKMGISIRKTNLEFKDFDEVLDEIAQKWQTMDNVSKRALANAFAGVRQQEAFMILLENYDKYKDLVKVSENSQGTAEKKYQSYRESYAAAKNEFTAALQQFTNSAEVSKLLRDLTKIGTKLVESLQIIGKFLPGIISNLMMYRTVTGKGLLNQGYNLFKGYKGRGIGTGGQINSTQKRAPFNMFKIMYRDLKSKNRPYTRAYSQLQEMDYLFSEGERATLQQKPWLSAKTKKALVSAGILQDKNQTLNYGQAIAALQGGKLDKETAEILNNDIRNTANYRKRPRNSEINVKNLDSISNKLNNAGGLKTSNAAKAQAALAFAEMGANIITTGYTLYKTAATTHKYMGESVESSKEAQKQGGAVAAAISTIPVIGSFLGPIIGEEIAKNIDKERDRANYNTKQANKRISELEGLNSTISSVKQTEKGSLERYKIVQQFKKNIFDPSNKDLRENLQKHLGNKSLYGVLEDINSNTEKSVEAIKSLELAQIQAEKAEIMNKYASSMYENNLDLNKSVNSINGLSGYEDGEAVGGGVGIGAASVVGGALTGLVSGAAIGSAATPIGTAVGAIVGLIVGAISGAVVGAVAGTNYAQTTAEQKKGESNSLKNVDNWSVLNSQERKKILENNIEGLQEKLSSSETYENLKKEREEYLEKFHERDSYVGEEGQLYDLSSKEEKILKATTSTKKANVRKIVDERRYDYILSDEEKKYLNDYAQIKYEEKQLQQYKEMNNLLQKQIDLEKQIFNEINTLTLQEGLIAAKIEDNATGKEFYLTEMSTGQLKKYGIDQILLSYANAIEEAGGLKQTEIWADGTKTALSESGYDYLIEQLKKQDDEEITSILSGNAYSLNEVLYDLSAKYGRDSIQVQKYLRNFSDSLMIPVEALEEAADRFGKLTLAEDNMSTSEITTKVEGLASVMNSVATGAGNISGWMSTIIEQYPELISYMGDTSGLYSEIIARMDQFSEVYGNSQYNSLMSSEALFKDLENKIYISLGEDSSAAEALRKNNNITKFSDIMLWLQQENNAGGLSEDAKNVAEAIKKIADDAGMMITSNILKQYYDQLISFKTQTIDKELENLESQKTALSEINKQREYENKLIEAKLKLEDAEKQKKRIYRAGVGWVYESDQSAIASAQKELESLDAEKKISQIDARILSLQGQKEELNKIYENQNYELLSKLYEVSVDEGKTAQDTNSAISMLKESVDGISKPLSEYIDQQLEADKDKKTKAMQNAKDAWDALNSSTPGSGDYNTALHNFHSTMETAVSAGAVEKDFEGDEWTYQVDDNRSFIDKGESAWSIYQGDEEDQKTKVKTIFNVKDPKKDNLRYYGYTNGELGVTTETEKYLLKAISKNRAYLWFDSENGQSLKDLSKSIPSYKYNKEEDTSLLNYLNRISKSSGHKQILISDPLDVNESAFYDDGVIYKITSGEDIHKTTKDYKGEGLSDAININKQPEYNWGAWNKVDAAATGTLGLLKDSTTLINELGTEAIITPQGTVTALPSRTGIVPADITKNLWELGEVAPSLIRILDGKVPSDKFGKSIFGDSTTDESFNVANLVMNVTADSSFDVDKFVNMIKTRAALTKNNSK